MNKNYQYYKQRKLFKPIDCLVPIVLVLLMVLTIITMTTPKGNIVEIYVNGTLYSSYNIEKDTTIDIDIDGNINQLCIKSGEISMTYANCENKLCTYHSPIKNVREQIICAPHGIVVIVKNDSTDIDGVTGGQQ